MRGVDTHALHKKLDRLAVCGSSSAQSACGSTVSEAGSSTLEFGARRDYAGGFRAVDLMETAPDPGPLIVD